MRNKAVAALAAARVACGVDDMIDYGRFLQRFGLTSEGAQALAPLANAAYVMWTGNAVYQAGLHLMGDQRACLICEAMRDWEMKGKSSWQAPGWSVRAKGMWTESYEPLGCKVDKDGTLSVMPPGVYIWQKCCGG